ncbi:hypothetical protein B0I35DRAFT_421150 [Stachybotrys elegans]|uniref:Uncharacterized protein n=1 Tax=Stachybotrys elegans TaxID=80388 RepID=A0A8K0T0N3_9HYPO|nr:hypothetical protein B0I35DRAFT_421150 [Stachybotrys elegans]
MGLPLFVAPVESDLPSKPVHKSRTTSPSRSSIRRPGWRENRGGSRRPGVTIYHTSLHPYRRQTPAEDGPRRDADNSGVPPGVSNMHRLFMAAGAAPISPAPTGPGGPDHPDHRREALREMTGGHPSLGSDRVAEQMTSLLGRSWQEFAMNSPHRRGGNDRTGADDVQHIAQYPTGPPQGMTARSETGPYSHRSLTREHDLPTLSRLVHLNQTRGLSSSLRSQEERNMARASRHRLRRRGQVGLRRPAVDGLGDRERSLSPESWDTLLTTLTPDPQPPSANSSFAIGAASDNAGSSAPMLRMPGDSANDAACDSAENSETEDADAGSSFNTTVNAPRTRNRRRRDITDAPTNGEHTHQYRVWLRPSEAVARSRRGADGLSARSGWDAIAPELWDGDAWGADDRMTITPPPRVLFVPAPPDGWVGRLSVGADDEDHAAEPTLNREGSAASGQNTSAGEEDLAGMRRIARSITRREDVPDEWWADVGLSRNLPRGEGN